MHQTWTICFYRASAVVHGCRYARVLQSSKQHHHTTWKHILFRFRRWIKPSFLQRDLFIQYEQKKPLKITIANPAVPGFGKFPLHCQFESIGCAPSVSQSVKAKRNGGSHLLARTQSAWLPSIVCFDARYYCTTLLCCYWWMVFNGTVLRSYAIDAN